MAPVRHPHRGLRCATLACGLTALLGSITVAPVHAADVAVEGATLRIVDSAGEANVLTVHPTPLGYDVFDEVSRLTPGAGCVAMARRHVNCQAMMVKLSIDAGDGDDFVMTGDVSVPVEASGGRGDDLVEGGAGTDLLGGGTGNDSVLGAGGDDGLAGEAGADVLQGGGGGDEMSGGADADVLEDDGLGGDRLSGDDGPDLLKGGRGDDTLDGGDGADVLATGSGTDTAQTGRGDDRVFATAGDSIACTGADKVSSPGAPPPGCRNLAADAEVPVIWPPPPATSTPPAAAGTTSGLVARAARTALPLPYGPKRARVLRRGEAHRIGVQIDYRVRMPIRVMVTTRRRNGDEIRTFSQAVYTRQAHVFPSQGPANRVWSASVRCCVG